MWEPRTAEWESQPTWPPNWASRQGAPPPPAPDPANPYAPGAAPTAPGTRGPSQPDTQAYDPYQQHPYQQHSYHQDPSQQDPYRRDPYQGAGYQGAGYPADPYAEAPYQPEPPPSDPYAMWGEPWEGQQETRLTAVRPRRRRRWPLMLVAGVIAVVLVVVFVPGVRDLIGQQGIGTAQAVPLGEAGTDGPLEFTARAVDCRVNSLGDTGITTDGVFCAVHLQVTNVGQEPLVLDPAAQRLFDQNDQELTVNDQWLALESRSFVQQLPAGVTANGVLMFDAPAGTQATRLELHATPDSEGITVEVTTS